MKAAGGFDEEQRQAAIAIAIAALVLAGFGRVCRTVGAGTGLVGAAVVDVASFGIAGCGIAASRDAGQRVTSTALPLLVFGRAGAWLVGAGGLVTNVLDRGAAHARGRFLKHAVRADQGVLPDFGTEQTGVAYQGHRSSHGRFVIDPNAWLKRAVSVG